MTPIGGTAWNAAPAYATAIFLVSQRLPEMPDVAEKLA